MDAMKGSVGVESEKSKGSIFWIELRVTIMRPMLFDNSQALIQLETHGGKKGTILYIEDNPSNVELVEQILSNHLPNMRLINNPNGRRTVQLATEYLPDLILLDLNLPDIHGPM